MPNQFTTPPAFITCETCGKTVRIKAYELTTARFCSRKCQGAPSTKHGHARNGQRAPEYDIWCAMLSRCQNPNNPFYPDYGGRGIVVCAAWHDYERFIADVGRRPSPDLSIDRLDPDGNYEPGNVAWRTGTAQQRNLRSNARLTVNGVQRLRIEWAELTGIKHSTIRSRLAAGWTPEQAVGIEPRR